MTDLAHASVVITGASQGIGAGLVAGFRALGHQVLATSRSIKESSDPDVLTVAERVGAVRAKVEARPGKDRHRRKDRRGRLAARQIGGGGRADGDQRGQAAQD